MDRELRASVLRAVRRAAAQVGWHGGRRRPVYSNGLIAAMYVWSVWHDRPLCWACRRGSYGALFRAPQTLPSVSQFSRRVRSDDCQRILQLAHDAFAQRGRVARTWRSSTARRCRSARPAATATRGRAGSAARSRAGTSCTRWSTRPAGSSSGA